MKKKKIAIMGSTGSIGKTLIDILKKDKKNFKILLLTAKKNYKTLLKQANLFEVKNLIITNLNSFLAARKFNKNHSIKIYNSFSSFNHFLKKNEIDYTMNAISGLDGLYPTLEIIKFTKKICIANKEAIICGWPLIENSLKKNNTIFIPVDSEHFSIWSLINKTKNNDIEKVFITASGGPFRSYPLKRFKSITLKQSLKHPNWKMGKKITIDSATMMNKVFEVIEAKKIFKYDYKKIEILIHPKSYVHAIVKFTNGLTKILIHDTNMKIPIFNTLYSGNEKKITTKKLDFKIINNLEFTHVDLKKFPIVSILKQLPKNDSLFETVLVTANDKLVNLYLQKKIRFTDISKILLKIVSSKKFIKYKQVIPTNINDIITLSKDVSFKIDTLRI